ncbi:DNA cytosine methyltransferase [Bacteroidales bacterium AH-315-I05]|nr:DNA cytosine methyltransferase [Bacteroidales bacterium AH-315-I05]
MPKKNSYITYTDQFCGAGGSSQGVRELAEEMGGGMEIKLALNHWKLAIETHNTNFPDTRHECTDISACDPRRYHSTDVLITSPECTNHSLAKGQKRKFQQQMEMFGKIDIDPATERSRATMWDVPRFAEFHDYNLIIVENVVDARYWVMWDAWLKAMHCLGYRHRCVYLNSMFCYPTPQSRDRMYIVFWKKGNPAPDLEYCPPAWCAKCEKNIEAFQSWRRKDKLWGKYKQQYDYRCPSCSAVIIPYYYAAFNCIDWTIPAQRIGDRKRPLAENTIKRIKYGLEKYANEPLIIATRYTSGIGSRVKQALSEPLGTQPADQSHAVLSPFMISRYMTGAGNRVNSVSDALRTQMTGSDHGVVAPFIINTEHSYNLHAARNSMEAMRTQATRQTAGIVVPFIIEMNRTGKARSVEEQLSTVLAGGNHHGLLQMPLIVENHGQSKSRAVTERMACITTRPKYGLVTSESFQAFLSYYYGNSQASNMAEAINTMTTKERASLLQYTGQAPEIDNCTYRMLKPHEIQKAMAFPDSYVILGNSKEKVKQCGNAVTPPAMKWLVKQGLQTFN